MRLNVRTWGTGPRTAVLVHGFSDDAETWWRVAPAIAEQGFTVLAPELRGHGASPRADTYALVELAQDLVDTLPKDVDLAIGHSLGAVVLALAAAALTPRRTVLVDPAWLRTRREVALPGSLPTTRDQLPRETAGWSDEDVAVDLASNALLDPRVAHQLLAAMGPDTPLPVTPPVGPDSLLVVPELDPLLPPVSHDELRALGYDIRTVPGVRHVIHRDDLQSFLDAVLLVDEAVS